MEDQDKTKDQLIDELRLHQIELEMQNEELKKSQDELEKSRDKYNDLYNFAPTGYLTVSNAGMIEEANLRAVQLLGVPRLSLIGRPIDRFISSEDGDVFYLHRRSCLDQQVRQTCEIRMVKGDGTVFFAQLESVAVVQDNEQPVQLRISIIDLTERKRMEKELEVREEKFRSIFENSLNSIVLAAPDGRILDANDAACQMFGRTRQELCEVGRDGVVDVTDSRLPAALEIAQREGKWRGELNHKRRDGTTFPAEAAVKTFPDSAGQDRVVVVTHDLTYRKGIESALLKSQERLELALEGADLGLWDLDLGTDRFFLGKRITEIAGYVFDEMEPTLESWLGLIHPDDRPQVEDHSNRVLKGFKTSLS